MVTICPFFWNFEFEYRLFLRTLIKFDDTALHYSKASVPRKLLVETILDKTLLESLKNPSSDHGLR